MTPEEIAFLSDIDKQLHELRMMILDRLLKDIDPEVRNRPLQDYVMEVVKRVGQLQRLGHETIVEAVFEKGPAGPAGLFHDLRDAAFEWDIQKDCRIISVDGGSVYVEWEGFDGDVDGQQFRYDSRTLGVEPQYGSVKRPSGSRKEWSFSFVTGQTEDNRDIHQFCGEGTRGWICINTSTGVTRFVPRPLDQQ